MHCVTYSHKLVVKVDFYHCRDTNIIFMIIKCTLVCDKNINVIDGAV